MVSRTLRTGRADVLAQVDACVGERLRSVEQGRLVKPTKVWFERQNRPERPHAVRAWQTRVRRDRPNAMGSWRRAPGWAQPHTRGRCMGAWLRIASGVGRDRRAHRPYAYAPPRRARSYDRAVDRLCHERCSRWAAARRCGSWRVAVGRDTARVRPPASGVREPVRACANARRAGWGARASALATPCA